MDQPPKVKGKEHVGEAAEEGERHVDQHEACGPVDSGSEGWIWKYLQSDSDKDQVAEPGQNGKNYLDYHAFLIGAYKLQIRQHTPNLYRIDCQHGDHHQNHNRTDYGKTLHHYAQCVEILPGAGIFARTENIVENDEGDAVKNIIGSQNEEKPHFSFLNLATLILIQWLVAYQFFYFAKRQHIGESKVDVIVTGSDGCYGGTDSTAVHPTTHIDLLQQFDRQVVVLVGHVFTPTDGRQGI